MSRVRHFFLIHHPAAPASPRKKEELAPLLDSCPPWHRGDWQVQTCTTFTAGWLAEGSLRDRPGTPPSASRTSVLWTGDLARPPVHSAEPPALAQDLVEGRRETIQQLDGAFATLAFDAAFGRATLVTDRFGLFPVYCHHKDDFGYYATSLRVLTALAHPEGSLDHGALYEMLCLGMVLGNRTFVREINLVPPAMAVLVGEERPRSFCYWSWQHLATRPSAPIASTQELVKETYRLVEKAVLQAVPPGVRRVALPLSGGLDSRLLCAVLAANDVPVQAYNMDFDGETAIARRVAAVLRVPLKVLPMLKEPARAFTDAHGIIDCSYHANQTWGWEMAHRAAQDGCDLLFDGLAFDTVLGSVHQVNGTSPAELAQALFRNYGEIDRSSCERIAGTAAAEIIWRSVAGSLVEAAHEALEQAGGRASDYFTLTNRIRKYTFGYCLANLEQLPCCFPYITQELFEHCMRLPQEQRREHRLYRQIYLQMFPELARIPWAKTGVPLDRYAVPRDVSWRGLLWTLVRRLSRDRLPFRAWSLDASFRTCPELRALFRKRWTSRALHGRAYLPSRTLPNAMRRHMQGCNLGAFLQGVYTVENFLARFVDEGLVTLINERPAWR